jgi:tetratricopeptide (TPR) repeat protein
MLGMYAPVLGRELCSLGRMEEAEALARQGRDLAGDTSADSPWWRRVQAPVLAHRGEHAEAERLAREAVAAVEQTDSLTFQGDAWFGLAEVLAAPGRGEDAAAALAEALDRYERKQNLPLARQVRERLAALEQQVAS